MVLSRIMKFPQAVKRGFYTDSQKLGGSLGGSIGRTGRRAVDTAQDLGQGTVASINSVSPVGLPATGLVGTGLGLLVLYALYSYFM